MAPPAEHFDSTNLPNHHRHHTLTEAERQHINGWNALLWLDYLNADAFHAQAILDTEREEIQEYEERDDEENRKADKGETEQHREDFDGFSNAISKNRVNSAAEQIEAVDHKPALIQPEVVKTPDGDDGLGAETYDDRDPGVGEDFLNNLKEADGKGRVAEKAR